MGFLDSWRIQQTTYCVSSVSFDKMFTSCVLCLSLLLVVVVVAQPTGCIEDAQCSTGLYCDVTSHSCKECYNCAHYGRQPPPLPKICIKYLAQCGACFKGLTKVYEGITAAKCVTPDAQRLGHSHWYLWSSALVAGTLVITTFLHVWRNTSVYRIAACYTFAKHVSIKSHNTINTEATLIMTTQNELTAEIDKIHHNSTDT